MALFTGLDGDLVSNLVQLADSDQCPDAELYIDEARYVLAQDRHVYASFAPGAWPASEDGRTWVSEFVARIGRGRTCETRRSLWARLHFGGSNGEEDDYVLGEDAKFATADADDIDRAILQARTDAKAWAIELERVGPRLATKAKVKDTWRRRIKLTHNSIERRHGLESVYAATTGTAQEARSACETLRRGEGVLDQRHSEAKAALMRLRASLREFSSKRDALESGVAQKTDRLSTVMDEAEEAQAAVEGRGADLGDTRRLATVRSALKGLRAESQELEMRLGVALAQTAAFARRGAPVLKDDASLSESSSS